MDWHAELRFQRLHASTAEWRNVQCRVINRFSSLEIPRRPTWVNPLAIDIPEACSDCRALLRAWSDWLAAHQGSRRTWGASQVLNSSKALAIVIIVRIPYVLISSGSRKVANVVLGFKRISVHFLPSLIHRSLCVPVGLCHG